MKRTTALICTLVTFVLALAIVAPARADAPAAVVKAFYDAYQKAPDRDQVSRKFLVSQRSRLEPGLYALLYEMLGHDPRKGDKVWLDFDPFVNAQMNAATIRFGAARQKGDTVLVPMYASYRVPGHEQQRVTIEVRRFGGAWKITNFLYAAEAGMKAWDLKSYLRKELRG